MKTKLMVLACLLTLPLIIALSGCQTMSQVGAEIRATVEPPVKKADDMVELVHQRAVLIDEIATRLATGEPVTQEEKAELVGLTNSAATATLIAKQSTERALFIIRLLPQPKETK